MSLFKWITTTELRAFGCRAVRGHNRSSVRVVLIRALKPRTVRDPKGRLVPQPDRSRHLRPLASVRSSKVFWTEPELGSVGEAHLKPRSNFAVGRRSFRPPQEIDAGGFSSRRLAADHRGKGRTVVAVVRDECLKTDFQRMSRRAATTGDCEIDSRDRVARLLRHFA